MKDIVRLTDGRDLAYAAYGAPNETAVFYFHGTPGSRLEPLCGNLPAGVRLIAPDRPGFGHSSPSPHRTLRDWADDIAELADHLGLGRIDVLGYSGGGPYALACAYRLGERISRVGLVSSQAPFSATGGPPEQTRAFYEAAKSDPEALSNQLAERIRDGEALWQVMTAELPQPDRAVFEHHTVAQAYRENLGEAIRQGVDEVVRELRLLAVEWPFSLRQVHSPVHLWHGGEDKNAPPNKGRYLADTLPDCDARFLPGQGHFFLFENWNEIFRDLVAGNGD